MTFTYLQVALICFAYLAVVFSLAYSTDRGWVSDRLVSHPITYICSLGILPVPGRFTAWWIWPANLVTAP